MEKNVKKLEIPIHFKNYKLLKDKELNLTGSYIYFVQGPNKTGKTSFLKALQSLQTGEDDTPIKVTTGESEGWYEAVIPSATGELIKIRHEFTDKDRGRFIAIHEDGTKVSKITELRSLFNYTPINVDQFFAMSNTADGRKKQRDIILKLLPETDYKKFVDADQQEQYWYEERTKKNREVETNKNALDSIIINPEDEALVPRETEAKKLKESYEEVKIFRLEKNGNPDQGISSIDEEIKELIKERDEYNEKIKKLNEKIDQLGARADKLDEFLKPYEEYSDEQLVKKIADGDEVISRITSLKTKVELKKEYQNKLQKSTKDSEDMTKKIEGFRKDKTEIVTKSELPVQNISFDDGYLTIDGYRFVENQVCESDAVLILANILAKVNAGPIQIIGDASCLDANGLEKLNEIAQKNNKVMFVDEVVRDAENLVVVGYEEITKKDLENKLTNLAGKNNTKKSTNKSTDNSVTSDNKSDDLQINKNFDEKPDKTEPQDLSEDEKSDKKDLLF